MKLNIQNKKDLKDLEDWVRKQLPNCFQLVKIGIEMAPVVVLKLNLPNNRPYFVPIQGIKVMDRDNVTIVDDYVLNEIKQQISLLEKKEQEENK